MKLYTVISDYFATGEGNTNHVYVAWAENEAEALKKFAEEFKHGDYFVQGAEVAEGVAYDHPIMQLFMSDYMKTFFRQQEEKPCKLVWAQRLYFNYS